MTIWSMRGFDIQQDTLFSTASPESRAPKDHPLRPVRTIADKALADLDADFDALYSEFGRDSIPLEKLLRAQLLMAFYTIRSERWRCTTWRGCATWGWARVSDRASQG